MVVLEVFGGNMLSAPANQYLQPDYLSPLPTTLDAKKSPLALLAQTCSQIGVDVPANAKNGDAKSTSGATNKKGDSSNAASIRSSPAVVRGDLSSKTSNKSHRSTPQQQDSSVFRPYENNVISRKSDHASAENGSRPSSTNRTHSESGKRTPNITLDRKSLSPKSSSSSSSSSHTPTQKSSTPSSASDTAQSSSPIIRSGFELLQSHQQQSKTSPLNPSVSLCCPSSTTTGSTNTNPLDISNPAFRNPYITPGTAAVSFPLAGYPMPAAGPYMGYARIKTPSGADALVPVCKDPYCTGCQYSLHNQQMMMGVPCPSGCTQCEHHKYNLAMAMSLMSPPGGGGGGSVSPYSHLSRPYVCSWVLGDNYCGKRFLTSEELLQHLRTHTATPSVTASSSVNGSSGTTPTSAAMDIHSNLLTTISGIPSTSLFRPPHVSAYSSLASATAPPPPLSPLSAARYHPYGKPPLGSGAALCPPFGSFSPAAAAALSSYYSPYAFYGHRLGAAAVHP